MATEKKYLDLQGLEHLKDQKILVKHPTKTAKDPAAVKVGQDANGHVILSNDPLTAADVGAVPVERKINNKPLSADITLSVSDISGAVPNTRTIAGIDLKDNITKEELRTELGITGAMHFAGTTLTALIDGATTNPIKIKQSTTDTTGKDYTAVAGDVVLYSNKEFIWTGSAWEILGDEGSYALKTRTITGDGAYITGGGDLTANRTLSHKTYGAKDAAPYKIGRDAGGHVVIGDPLTISEEEAGGHSHTTTSSIPANTYVDTVTRTTATLKTTPTFDDTFLKSYSGTSGRLETTTISGVSGSTTASKATAQTAKDIAKAGTAVKYGIANPGTAVTVATRASTQTTVGNANKAATATVVGDADVGDAITITGVEGSTTASKASAGDVVSVAKAGTAVTVATRAATSTVVGNASVGDEITITGVSGSVTASKATAQTAKSVAKVGSAVTYGTADPDTAVTGVAKVGNQITYGAANVGTAVKVTAYNASTPAYTAAYDSATECLNLTAIGSTSINPAVASSSKAYVCADGTGVSIVPAKASTKTLTPAADNGTITPYTFADVTVPKAATSETTFYAAVESTTKIWGVGGTTAITPAVDNGTITPYTFTDVTVPVAAKAITFNPAEQSETSIYGAVESSTRIWGVGGTTDITPAVEAPDTQTIVPAVANGTITPYTFANVTVPIAASEITVATGEVSKDGEGGSVLVGLGDATTGSALTGVTVTAGDSGTTVVTGVSSSKNVSALSISGTTSEVADHKHNVEIPIE